MTASSMRRSVTSPSAQRLLSESGGSQAKFLGASFGSTAGNPLQKSVGRNQPALSRTYTQKIDQANPKLRRSAQITDKSYNSSEKVQLNNAAKFARSSKQIWEKAAIAVDEAIASNRGSNTIDHEKAEQSYSLVIQGAEERLRITDQQAVDELEHFKSELEIVLLFEIRQRFMLHGKVRGRRWCR